MKRLSAFLVLFAVAAVLPVGAQTKPKTVAEIIRVKVNAGQRQQWEAGFKSLDQWERQHNIPDTFYVWSIIAGKHTGEYYVGSFGHGWKDFDQMPKFDTSVGSGKEIQATVGPYTESIERSFYEFQPDLSPKAPSASEPPPAFSSVLFFHLKPGGMDAFMDTIKQVNEAIKKANWAGGHGEWYVLAEGGDYPELVLADGHKDWASFQSLSPSLRAVLEQVYGKAGFEALGHTFDKNLKSESGEVLRYRPDLSYIAASR